MGYFEGKPHTGCTRRGWCLLCEFQTHVERKLTSSSSFSPAHLVSKISKVGRQFSFGRQEDAHEYTQALLDGMHMHFLDERGGEKAFDFRTRETTSIYHIFGGYTAQQVTCAECEHVSSTYTSFLGLNVEVTTKITSIEEALRNNYAGVEWLDCDNKYKCDKCKKLVRASKGDKLHRSPNALVLSMKRYTVGRFGKINKRVKIIFYLRKMCSLREMLVERHFFELIKNFCIVKRFNV